MSPCLDLAHPGSARVVSWAYRPYHNRGRSIIPSLVLGGRAELCVVPSSYVPALSSLLHLPPKERTSGIEPSMAYGILSDDLFFVPLCCCYAVARKNTNDSDHSLTPNRMWSSSPLRLTRQTRSRTSQSRYASQAFTSTTKATNVMSSISGTKKCARFAVPLSQSSWSV